MTTDRINEFLESIDLVLYRDKYAHIKLVELDMPRNIRPIPLLYREYWMRREDYPTFEKFYAIYAEELGSELEIFRQQAMFSEETFCRGLPARIYRTWASLLTQIQGGYAAEEIYGVGNIEMSTELDYQGVVMRITDDDNTINIQIKKETLSREVRTPWHSMKNNIPLVNLTYEVPGCGPLTRTGRNSVPFARWNEKWQGKLMYLNNGFVIFMPEMFSRGNIIIP